MIKVSLHFLSTLLNAEYIGRDSADITEVTIDTRRSLLVVYSLR